MVCGTVCGNRAVDGKRKSSTQQYTPDGSSFHHRARSHTLGLKKHPHRSKLNMNAQARIKPRTSKKQTSNHPSQIPPQLRTVQVWGRVRSVWSGPSVDGAAIPPTLAKVFAWKVPTGARWGPRLPGSDHESATWFWIRVCVHPTGATTGPSSSVLVNKRLFFWKIYHLNHPLKCVQMFWNSVYVLSYLLIVCVVFWQRVSVTVTAGVSTAASANTVETWRPGRTVRAACLVTMAIPSMEGSAMVSAKVVGFIMFHLSFRHTCWLSCLQFCSQQDLSGEKSCYRSKFPH